MLQVRAAAVFALGTFISNTTEHSDHANNIDHGVAMTLLSVTQDGSSLVRKVRCHDVTKRHSGRQLIGQKGTTWILMYQETINH